jgi:hypothetical protein
MSATDALNLKLFHGSHHLFEVGDIISPEYDTAGEGEAHATNDMRYASKHGDYLYEVSALDTPTLAVEDEDTGTQHWVSREGYKVNKRVY